MEKVLKYRSKKRKGGWFFREEQINKLRTFSEKNAAVLFLEIEITPVAAHEKRTKH
jgi:hypothetical protein